jgi:hypothetical protein
MIGFGPRRVVKFALVFQDIDEDQVRAPWKPYFGLVEHTEGMLFTGAPVVVDMPARYFWNGAYYRQHGLEPGRLYAGPAAPKFLEIWMSSLSPAERLVAFRHRT